MLAQCRGRLLPAETSRNHAEVGATDNLEVKKLVYLYLINYAKSKPDLAIMAVNIFVRVRSSPAPQPC